MTIQEISTLVTTIGLPSALCIFFVWQNHKNETYYQNMLDKMRKTIDNNTKAIMELANLIKRGDT